MSLDRKDWFSLTEASEMLGVHPTTLRRWADAGSIPCLRTPGGHRRFRISDLAAWMQGKQSAALAPRSETLVQSAVGYTRQEMALQRVSGESWYTAFEHEAERQQMRDTGRKLFGLAVQYMGRTRDHEPVLQEGRRIGEFFGQQCAQHGISLVDTVRAQFFFRESLLRAARPGQGTPGQYDDEDVRIHRQLRYFLDEVMYACLESYETTCRHLLGTETDT
ncbi:MAG: helix-turn-helix domain-containing protein [Anaerolineae bacterium]|jgi:excisionase family DNA binding protein